jgi:mannose-1-phosphate guanylyltransferase
MTKPAVSVVVLAGGQGTRFWPISRMARPKQFLSISASGESLIQATARRVQTLIGEGKPLIVTNRLHREMILEHVPNADLICEPMGRNTAASIGLAALKLAEKDPDTIMVVLPADHFVSDEEGLVTALQDAVTLATTNDYLVTLGIPPANANTAYGYIKRGKVLSAGRYLVQRFFEKPSFERATKYVEEGDFYWNSGMFVWRARTLLAALKEQMPELYSALLTVTYALGKPNEAEVMEPIFRRLESVSIDFGVLEHARNCAVVEAGEIGWNDVGSWDAWADRFKTDSDGNLLHGDALAIESKGCVVYSKNRSIAVLGCEDLIIIDSKDAMLVCPRARVQDVRKVVEELKARGRTDLI